MMQNSDLKRMLALSMEVQDLSARAVDVMPDQKQVIWDKMLAKWFGTGRFEHLSDMDNAMEVMESLNNGDSLTKAIGLMRADGDAQLVRNMVTVFADRGINFYMRSAEGPVSDVERKNLNKISAMNQMIQKANYRQESLKTLPDFEAMENLLQNEDVFDYMFGGYFGS